MTPSFDHTSEVSVRHPDSRPTVGPPRRSPWRGCPWGRWRPKWLGFPNRYTITCPSTHSTTAVSASSDSRSLLASCALQSVGDQWGRLVLGLRDRWPLTAYRPSCLTTTWVPRRLKAKALPPDRQTAFLLVHQPVSPRPLEKFAIDPLGYATPCHGRLPPGRRWTRRNHCGSNP